jgi:hypothetical protein
MSEFKYGDMVEGRDSVNQAWSKPHFYLGGVPYPDKSVVHFTMKEGQNESNFDGLTTWWNYIRKPGPTLTIKERLERLEAALGLGPNPQD